MNKHRGFTLIELMVVVIVIAVLAAIALPSYLNQTRKSRRSQVEGAIQQIALLEERYRADCTTYGDFSATCATTTATMPAWSTVYTQSYYGTPTIGNISGTGYKITIVASSTGKQDKDTASGTSCKTLTYDYGVTTSGAITKTPAACW